jgi:hypothetical protein
LAGLMVPAALSVVERWVVWVEPPLSAVGGLGSGILTGKRGVWPTAKRGVQPKSGKSPP